MIITLLMAVLLFASSCERRPFAERTTGVNLLLKVNTKIENTTDVPVPDMMRIDLYDPVTGEIQYTDYVGPDGGYIYPAPGTYDLIVYNIGTESTVIRNEANYDEVEAYTNDISAFLKAQMASFLTKRAQARAERERARQEANNSSTKVEDPETSAPEERIVYEPDHLFVGHAKSIEIPVMHVDEEDLEIVIEVGAETVVETWVIEVANVIGLQWVQNAVAIMSGQVESYFIGRHEDSENVVSIFFEMEKNKENGSILGRFNTFGKHPNEISELSFDVNITDTGGNDHHFHFDVTSEFFDNPNKHIVIEEVIEIEEPKTEGGGFDPSVEDWEDIQTDIIL